MSKARVEILPGGDLDAARRLTPREFERVANKYLWMSLEQIQEVMGSKKIPIIDYMVISIIKKGLDEGDPKYLSFLLSRLIGNVIPIKTLNPEDDPNNRSVMIPMTVEEELEMLDVYRKDLLNARNK